MSYVEAPDRIGPYRVVRRLGAGGMGIVYEALNETIERRVAIKVLLPDGARNPELTQRFFNEARAVNRINHPCIVQVSDFGQSSDGAAFIVMELLDGESLAKRLQRLGGRGSLAFSLQLGWQLATALAAAHAKGIIHRDLKPDNVMLVADPVAAGGERAKLLDFGIAKLAADARGGNTASQIIMGTPAYMSPEQCRGAGSVDERSDVYALGVMLFQLFAGRLPFIAEGAGELIALHLFQEPPGLGLLVPTLPAEVSALVHRLLAKDRQQRPTMREVVALLEPMLAAYGQGAPAAQKTLPRLGEGSASLAIGNPSTLGHSSGQRQSRWATQLPLAAGLLVAVLMVGGAGLLYRQKKLSGRTPTATAATQDLRHASSLEKQEITPALAVALEKKSVEMESKQTETLPEKPEHPTELPTRESGRTSRRGAARRASLTSSVPAEVDKSGREVGTPPTPSPGVLKAQQLGASGDWDGMLRLVQTPELQQADGLRAWELTGKAACHLRRTTLASEAYHRVGEAGREAIRTECASVGITVRGTTEAEAGASAEAWLQLASEHLFHSHFREAIAVARPLIRARPEEAWRIIGQAACSLRDTAEATQARRALSAASQKVLDQACAASGLVPTADVYNIIVR